MGSASGGPSESEESIEPRVVCVARSSLLRPPISDPRKTSRTGATSFPRPRLRAPARSVRESGWWVQRDHRRRPRRTPESRARPTRRAARGRGLGWQAGGPTRTDDRAWGWVPGGSGLSSRQFHIKPAENLAPIVEREKDSCLTKPEKLRSDRVASAQLEQGSPAAAKSGLKCLMRRGRGRVCLPDARMPGPTTSSGRADPGERELQQRVAGSGLHLSRQRCRRHAGRGRTVLWPCPTDGEYEHLDAYRAATQKHHHRLVGRLIPSQTA